MGLDSAYPSPILSPYIKQYWGLENLIPPGKKHIQRIVPHGLTEMLFYLAEVPDVSDRSKSISAIGSVSGQINHYYDIIISGKISLFSVLFQPLGLKVLFGIPIREFYNQNTPLEFLVKHEADELESKLMEVSDFADRIKIIESFFVRRLSNVKKQYALNRLQDSISIINQYRTIVNIDFLASRACLSRKQYERSFSNFIGTTPKQFLKTLRFQLALHEKSKYPERSLSNLAYACGYYDQAHMISEFKMFSGMTPGQYFVSCVPFSDYFS